MSFRRLPSVPNLCPPFLRLLPPHVFHCEVSAHKYTLPAWSPSRAASSGRCPRKSTRGTPPRTRISSLSAAHRKASRKPPPTHVPRAAPPCRQTMNLDSIVAYNSRFDRWCGATRGGFCFSWSFFRSQMCRVGRRRHRPWGRRAARSANFLLFLRGRVLCESKNIIGLYSPACTRTHGTHVPRRVTSHRSHTPP